MDCREQKNREWNEQKGKLVRNNTEDMYAVFNSSIQEQNDNDSYERHNQWILDSGCTTHLCGDKS